MLARLCLAFSFLTIVRLGRPAAHPDIELGRSASFFPLIGWVIGLLLFGAAWLLSLAGTPSLTTAVILVGLEAWLTRGLHLDGLADLFDGLGGAYEPAKRLAIMKDSSSGVFGVIGLVVVLLLKVSCLTALLNNFPIGLILVAIPPAAARLAMAGLAFKSKYPRDNGTGHAFVGKVTGSDLLIGAILILPVIFAGWAGIIMVLAAQLPALWLRRKARLFLGGVTGDVLGASCEMGEAAGWLAAVLYLGAIL